MDIKLKTSKQVCENLPDVKLSKPQQQNNIWWIINDRIKAFFIRFYI